MSSPSTNPDGSRASRVVHGVGKDLGGFKKFLLRGNVVDLAVGVVIGAAFASVVQAFVRDFMNPMIALLGGQPDAGAWALFVRGVRFPVGDFVNALVSFILVALVVYFLVVLPVNKLMDRYRPERPPAPTKECPECTSSIPEAARRCPECAAQLLPPSAEVA